MGRTDSAPTVAADEASVRIGARVGRYRVIGVLGAGGMGTVYEAHDPQLDRRVAIKLLHARLMRPGTAARLLREGQALAHLAHPNVVAVYEAGRHDASVFIAMELVRGENLAQWLAQPRAWRDVLRVFVAAGRGLAAAHDAGLVHRDFKPSNVCLTDDTDVKLLDFGLARALADDGEPPPSAPRRRASPGLLHTRMTEAGAVLGTPPYMPAEQFAGARVDHRADQHAFCVSLYEALYGRRPFPSLDLEVLRRSVFAGDIGPRPRANVPRALWSIVRRGMSPDPSHRWPSMHALVARLERASRRHRGRDAIVVGSVIAVGVGVVLASRPAAHEPCARPEAALEAVWNPERRDAVERGLAAVGGPHAEEIARRVVTRIDAYAVEWIAARGEACRATHARAEQSAADLDLRMRCLDQRRDGLDATLTELADADDSVLYRAVAIAADLPPLSLCADPGALHAGATPPDDASTARRVELLRAELGRLQARRVAGRTAGLADEVDALLDRAHATGHEPLRAEALALDGTLAADLGDYERAEERLADAYWTATAAGHDPIAASAATALAHVVGAKLLRTESGLAWARHAQGVIERMTIDEVSAHALAGRVDAARGAVLMHAGRHEQALAALARAHDNLVQAHGAESPAVASVDMTRAAVLLDLARYDEAGIALERVIDRFDAAYGPGHPLLASALGGLASARSGLGAHAEAAEHLRAAIAIVEQAQGARHPTAGKLHHNLGGVLERHGDLDEAAASYRASLDIATEALGPEHPEVAGAMVGLAGVDRLRGDLPAARRGLEEAARLFESAPFPGGLATVLVNLAGVQGELGELELSLATFERAEAQIVDDVGADHPQIAELEIGRGSVLLRAGRVEDAVAAGTRALEIATATLPAESELVVTARTRLGAAELAAGHTAQALALLSRAAQDADRSELAPAYVAEVRLELATAQRAAGNRQAIDTARRALAALPTSGAMADTMRARIENFLGEH